MARYGNTGISSQRFGLMRQRVGLALANAVVVGVLLAVLVGHLMDYVVNWPVVILLAGLLIANLTSATFMVWAAGNELGWIEDVTAMDESRGNGGDGMVHGSAVAEVLPTLIDSVSPKSEGAGETSSSTSSSNQPSSPTS